MSLPIPVSQVSRSARLTIFSFCDCCTGRFGSWEGASTKPHALDADMARLNQYLQAEKAASVNVESLYADLQKKFNFLKDDWEKAEADRQVCGAASPKFNLQQPISVSSLFLHPSLGRIVSLQAMRKAVQTAHLQVQKLSTQNQRLTELLTEVHKEHAKLAETKETMMEALALHDKLNLTAALEM